MQPTNIFSNGMEKTEVGGLFLKTLNYIFFSQYNQKLNDEHIFAFIAAMFVFLSRLVFNLG